MLKRLAVCTGTTSRSRRFCGTFNEITSYRTNNGGEVFHIYSAYARGLDLLFRPNFLDLTPDGRQVDWENSPPGWPQRPTYV